jgi:AcrR family transcriptional regulator
MPPFGSRIRSEPITRGSRTVSRILDSAAKLFGREGYRGATMTDVAKGAGVSKGLLHYHFESKEHLLIEAQRATFRRVYDHIDGKVRRGDRGVGTALEALDAMWEAVRDMRTWAPFLVETMALANQEGPIREHLDDFYAEAEGLLAQGVRHVFGPEVDRLVMPPERLARLVRTVIHGLIVELAYARNPADVAKIDQSYRDMRKIFENMVLLSG